MSDVMLSQGNGLFEWTDEHRKNLECKQKFAWRVERRREVYQGVIRRDGDSLRLVAAGRLPVGKLCST